MQQAPRRIKQIRRAFKILCLQNQCTPNLCFRFPRPFHPARVYAACKDGLGLFPSFTGIEKGNTGIRPEGKRFPLAIMPIIQPP